MLDKDERDRFDEKYVKQTDCNERHCALDKRMAAAMTSVTVLSHDLTVIKKVLYAIAMGIGLGIVDRILDLIMH